MMKLIALILIVGLGIVALGLFLASDCEDTVKTELKSPDGKYVATLYERDCGATTDFSTIVNLRDSSASFKGDDLGIVIVKGQHKLDLVWDSDRKLRFQCHDCRIEDIFKQEKTWKDVDISFLY
jgi:hypothetical protein